MDDQPLAPNDILRGFCGGAFDRESYADKRVEAIGRDWVVAREIDGPRAGRPVWCFGDPSELERYR